MTTDAALLLQASRENPLEDTPRLMLADAIQDEYEGAATYIRDGIAHDAADKRNSKKHPRRRKPMAQAYAKWLESVLGIPHHPSLIGGQSWDTFHWRRGEKWDVNQCRLDIERGLPSRIAISCPMFMEQASKLFLFPLTEVKVTGRTPERDDVIPPVEYLWIGTLWPQTWNTWEDTPHELPYPLYQLLPLEALPEGRNLSRGRYTKSSRALAALNTAALTIGRAVVRTSCVAQQS